MGVKLIVSLMFCQRPYRISMGSISRFTTNLSLKLPYMAFAFGLNASSAGTPSRRFMTRHGRVDRQAIGSQQPRPLGLRW